MAFTKIEVSKDEWTLVGANVTKATFQNVGSIPIYINATATATAPPESIGLIYPNGAGEASRAVGEITTGGGAYIWARATTGLAAAMIVEVAQSLDTVDSDKYGADTILFTGDKF